MTAFYTSAAYLSGAICGHMWWPSDSLAGFPLQIDLRSYDGFGKFSDPAGTTFRDVLLSILRAKGGDFQDAEFSEDTVIRIERRAVDAPGRYRVHVREFPVSSLPDCEDLVRSDSFACDFFGEEF